jgi:hypothetical protein
MVLCARATLWWVADSTRHKGTTGQEERRHFSSSSTLKCWPNSLLVPVTRCCHISICKFSPPLFGNEWTQQAAPSK